MLDKNTLKWLEEREIFTVENEAWYSCAYCEKFEKNKVCWSALCPVEVGHVVHRDVAEFEARVARILATERAFLDTDGVCYISTGIKCPNLLCSECRIKYARLIVEEEMEEEHD